MRDTLTLCLLAFSLTASAALAQSSTGDDSVAGTSVGADVIVYGLSGYISYGTEYSTELGEMVSGFAVGTIACNVGDENLVWFADTNQHPVIAQNMYRLMDNRFEQVGLAWVKHGFFATDSSHCDTCSDTDGSVPGYYLAVGCSDLYSASLNGNWIYLGPRSEINAHTGYNPGPVEPTQPPSPHISERRLQVANSDLEPTLNPGAEYYLEGHYVTPDDARDNNDDNNIAYRRVLVLPSTPDHFVLADSGDPGVSETAAIYAWAAADPSVVITPARVPNEGLFLVGAKSSDLGDGFYAYEYAIFNMNSDRSGGSFSVPIPTGAVVRNVGFHDVFYHSGEVYASRDWISTVGADAVTWATVAYSGNPNANALRWSTLYNFRFECTATPGLQDATLGLFKPGTPEAITITVEAPLVAIPCSNDTHCDDGDFCTGIGTCNAGDCVYSFVSDCNGNGREDDCDVVEDPVHQDCNGNLIQDECDLISGYSQDLNGNGIPDECCDQMAPPQVEPSPVRKNRYISLQPPLLGAEYAIRVQLVSPEGFPLYNGGLRWVGEPQQMPDEFSDQPGATFTAARLSCEPHYVDWSTISDVHIYGGGVVPGSVYQAQTLSGQCAGREDESVLYSVPLEITTLPWGDVVEPWFDNAQGVPQPDFKDISSVVAKFLAAPDSPMKAQAQLQPDFPMPWQQINFKDIAAAVSAFVGDPFPYHGPCDCPATVPCGVTACTNDTTCAPGYCVDGFCTDECGRCLPQ